MNEEIEVYVPATIANVVCGFDVLGFALTEPRDRMVLRKIDEPGVRVVHHDEFGISCNPPNNTAGVALEAMLRAACVPFGIEVEIMKRIRPGGGLGSSAASAAGAAVGGNVLLGSPFCDEEVADFAISGEALASGSRHADNVAPALRGGFTLVRSVDPTEIVNVPYPPLFVSVLQPQIEIKTANARSILPSDIPLSAAIKQSAHLGSLIVGLSRGDYELISRSLQDFIIQPIRKKLIPGFDRVHRAAIDAGSLGGGIAGSGPSIFMLSETREIAYEVGVAMANAYKEECIDFAMYVTEIGSAGVCVI